MYLTSHCRCIYTVAINISLYLGFPCLSVSSLLPPNHSSDISGYPGMAVSSRALSSWMELSL